MITVRLLNIVLLTTLLITAGCDSGTGNTSEGTASPDHQQDDRNPKQEKRHEGASGLQHIQSVTDTSPGKQVIEPFPNVRVVIQQNRGASRSTVTVYSNEKRIHSYQNHQFHRLYAYRFRGTGYVFIEMWEGGMHCCFPTTVYSVSGDELRFLHTFELGHAYFDPDRDLFTRSGNLYYRMKDDRFAYYRVSFAASIFMNRYFRFTPHAIAEVNEQFRNAFQKQAREHRKRLMDIISMPEQKARSLDVDAAEEGWFPALLGYTVNMVMAGKQAEAWEGFDRLYGKIRSRHPSWLKDTEPGMLKEEIQSEISESEK